MSYVASRELRNNTAGVLRRVQDGEEVIITVNGKPAAEIVPLHTRRRRRMTRAELIDLLEHGQADPGLRDDLLAMGDEATDYPQPIV
ncbi:type II toxin-antitoxin system prevent-host-death family antitoxin [Pengzhenrongella sp.]|jgi:prevent-host-death family protein|uniref:type II toxin-antitoxin system Phd/YefM family antitoxin n=1 Tax=Pengzhenrongella sp. TaxID=2888820 RepID=UPI002F928620